VPILEITISNKYGELFTHLKHTDYIHTRGKNKKLKQGRRCDDTNGNKDAKHEHPLCRSLIRVV